MKRIQLFALLCLLITSPISIVTADMGVTWVRTGVVLETQHKNGIEGEINVATMSNGAAHASVETPIIQRLDANRVLLQFRMATESQLPIPLECDRNNSNFTVET